MVSGSSVELIYSDREAIGAGSLWGRTTPILNSGKVSVRPRENGSTAAKKKKRLVISRRPQAGGNEKVNAVGTPRHRKKRISAWPTLIFTVIVNMSGDGIRNSKNSKCRVGRRKGNVG